MIVKSTKRAARPAKGNAMHSSSLSRLISRTTVMAALVPLAVTLTLVTPADAAKPPSSSKVLANRPTPPRGAASRARAIPQARVTHRTTRTVRDVVRRGRHAVRARASDLIVSNEPTIVYRQVTPFQYKLYPNGRYYGWYIMELTSSVTNGSYWTFWYEWTGSSWVSHGYGAYNASWQCKNFGGAANCPL
jgi:hypothetical protein